ncbi:GDP-mannose 4,6-dehydratase [Candidatus Parcubacteria bacterium]|nr:GDP-mannose 4,6-dehydratase [Candidatus Parcubacteria bacterium]
MNFAAESISEETYLPIWNRGNIEVTTLKELFEKVVHQNKTKVVVRKDREIINFAHKNYKVLSYKGGIGYWMPIKQMSRHKYKGKLIRLSQKWGEITATPNHSIYDCDFNLTTPLKNPELLGLRNINHISKKKKYLNFSGKKLKVLLRVLGAYISEGWTTYNKRNGSYHFGISNTDEEQIVLLKDDLLSLGYRPNITKTKGGLFQLIISNKGFFNFVRKEAGFRSAGKFIPSFIFQLETSLQQEFLRLLVWGDGQEIVNKNYKTTRYVTKSKKLATGLSLLLSLFHYNYSVGYDKRFNAYIIVWGNDYTISLINKEYTEIPYDGYVYDISVDNLKNFVCGVGNIVVHNTHVDRSLYEPGSFIKTDVYGTWVLLEVVKRFKIKKYLQVSTDEVYGDVSSPNFSKETDLLHPSSPYSASKAGGDMQVLASHRTFDLPILITRSSNNYGPFQYPEKIVPLFITNCLENKEVPVYDGGTQIRDWLYVEDNCTGIDTVLHKGEFGEIYNIGANQEPEITNLELTKTILKLTEKDESLIKHVTGLRPGHDQRYAVDTTKIRKLGWEPKMSFKEGMSQTVYWYVKNQDWWKKIKSGEYLEYYKKHYRE